LVVTLVKIDLSVGLRVDHNHSSQVMIYIMQD